MLEIHRDEGPDMKIYFSHSVLPSYIDPQNVSTKKKPFCTFNTQPFSHTLDLILSKEIYELVQARLDSVVGVSNATYARVFMKLGELLEGDFFTEYIKKGNIMMLSEGRPLVDNVFSFYEGVLKMELDRPTYEKCGLQGIPIEDGGKKHKKARWVVEFDLRAPSMIRGKKGFSRLEWACKNVLNQSLTWLFYSLDYSSTQTLREGREPISKHQPFLYTMEPTVTHLIHVVVPSLNVADLGYLYKQENALSLQEYIHLLCLGSPRVSSLDHIDPHLSRYEVPDFHMESAATSKDLVKLTWRGFICPQFVRELFLMVRQEALKLSKGTAEEQPDGAENRWIVWNAPAFGGRKGWTVMQCTVKDTLVWEWEV